ncbi:MAG: CPBP family intramembrane metalloprotease [FCB group bacterium]|nr:CPBP family intramembrane metalloprotease [FCB group bacterium]
MTLRKSFLSERIWPVVRVLILQLVLLAGILGNIVGWLALVFLVDVLHWLDIDFHGKTLSTISPEGKIVGIIILLSVNLVLILSAWRWLERKRLPDMWLVFSRKQGKYLAGGLAVGLGEMLVVFGSMVAVGVIQPSWGLARVPAGTVLMALGWLFASSVLGPIVEEVLNRGYWFQNIKQGWGVAPAIIVTALLFGGMHLFNPNAELLGAINIMLSAVTYALSLVWLRSLWFPIGWHAGWNFAQFFIAGLPNSGISVTGMGLEGTTLLVSKSSGSHWISGGEFGMEASLVRTGVLIVAIIVLLWLKKNRPVQ